MIKIKFISSAYATDAEDGRCALLRSYRVEQGTLGEFLEYIDKHKDKWPVTLKALIVDFYSKKSGRYIKSYDNYPRDELNGVNKGLKDNKCIPSSLLEERTFEFTVFDHKNSDRIDILISGERSDS